MGENTIGDLADASAAKALNAEYVIFFMLVERLLYRRYTSHTSLECRLVRLESASGRDVVCATRVSNSPLNANTINGDETQDTK